MTRRSAAQRRASRRNLARARAAKRRRAQQAEFSRGLAVAAGVGVLLMVGIGAVSATHGFLLIVPIGAVAAWVMVWLRRRRQHAALLAHEAQQRDVREAERRFAAQEIGRLLAMSATDFELAVGAVLRGAGYTDVQHVGGKGDKGADLLAIDPYGRRVVVQCKRYGPDNKVGSPEVQRFLGAIQINFAQRGLLVTTSAFTKDAEEIARGSNALELIDGHALVHMARAQAPARAVAPGWYADPQGAPALRWWDGRRWTTDTAPASGLPSQRVPGPDVAGR